MIGRIRRMIKENFLTNGNSRPLTSRNIATVLGVSEADVTTILNGMDDDGSISLTAVATSEEQVSYVHRTAAGTPGQEW